LARLSLRRSENSFLLFFYFLKMAREYKKRTKCPVCGRYGITIRKKSRYTHIIFCCDVCGYEFKGIRTNESEKINRKRILGEELEESKVHKRNKQVV